MANMSQLLKMLVFAASVVHLSCSDDDQMTAPQLTGTLIFTANGEAFVRDGFVSKDGWQLEFTHFYVTLEDVTAFQVPVTNSEKSLPAHAGHAHADLPSGSAHIVRFGQIVVDLAAGEAPTEISRDTAAPIGNYNYLHFTIAPARSNAAGFVEEVGGFSIVMIGTASKASTDVAFTIKLTETLKFRHCGPTTSGIVAQGGQGTVEVTFHSDHIFGDQETLGESDSVNDIAVGFAPFFAFADTTVTPNVLEVDQATLASSLSAAEYKAFLDALRSVGHSGEAHCQLAE